MASSQNKISHFIHGVIPYMHIVASSNTSTAPDVILYSTTCKTFCGCPLRAGAGFWHDKDCVRVNFDKLLRLDISIGQYIAQRPDLKVQSF